MNFFISYIREYPVRLLHGVVTADGAKLPIYVTYSSNHEWGIFSNINIEHKSTVKKELQIALKRLPERERMIMVLYYHENMTLKEIGETINVSESRVCQLHAQAIMKLKNILSSNRTDRLKRSIV